MPVAKPEGYETFRTVSELAKFCGTSTRTMERLWSRGQLPEAHRTDTGMKLWSPEACDSVLAKRISQLPSERARSRRIT